jgi:cytochrome c oxidase subunit 3
MYHPPATIPYTTEIREDTGLYNGKLGMWLFIASEVMLFGALFSAYVFLRIGAREGDWPHGLLNIPLGAFNTLVLITSSLTVALSWTALKMGDFQRYRRLQFVTIACASAFLGIKSLEYLDKFSHYEIWLKTPITVKEHPQLAGQAVEADDPITSVIGHIEGLGPFESLATLKEAGTTTVTLHPDAFHYRLPAREQAERRKAAGASQEAAHAGDEAHAGVPIDVSRISRLSPFVPRHGTYFASYFTLTSLHALHVFGGILVFVFILWPGARMWRDDPERYTNRVEVAGLFWHFVDLVWIFLFPILYLL